MICALWPPGACASGLLAVLLVAPAAPVAAEIERPELDVGAFVGAS